MKHASPSRQRLTALGLAGLLAFSQPLLGLAGGEAGGLPGSVLYLFGVWAALIALAAAIAERGHG